jgi:hypothetical protein
MTRRGRAAAGGDTQERVARGHGSEATSRLRACPAGRRATDGNYCGSLVKAGNAILPVATLAGQMVTGLPFCHCTIRPVI